MKNNKTTNKKQTAVATIKVTIALTLLLTAMNLAGYVALNEYGKYFCAVVVAVVGLYTLVRNSK